MCGGEINKQTNKKHENDVLFSNDTGKLGKKKFRVLLSGVEPKSIRTSNWKVLGSTPDVGALGISFF